MASRCRGLEQAERANYLLAIQAGFLLGLLITGMVADLLRKTRYQAVHVFGGGVFLLIGVQVLLAFGITSGLFAIWFLYGLLSSATFLAYAAQTAHFSDDVSGRAMTAMNFLMFALPFLSVGDRRSYRVLSRRCAWQIFSRSTRNSVVDYYRSSVALHSILYFPGNLKVKCLI